MNKIYHNLTLDSNTKNTKYVAFDLDYTLIKPKSGRKFPIDADDWTWLYESIPDILKKLHSEGYHILIITNQSYKKVESVTTKLYSILNILDITATAFVCYEEPYRKPCRRNIIENIDPLSIKFYCGDAVGRSGDFSNTDLLFAFNLGLQIYTPEEYFINSSTQSYEIPPPLQLEHNSIDIDYIDNHVIIMCGYPASGKSSFAKSLSDKYLVISQDIYKTLSKTKKVFMENIGKRPIIIDNTSPDIKSREFYIEQARLHDISIDCVHCFTPLHVAYHLNYLRCEKSSTPKFIPKIAYFTYRKIFQPPSLDEGFSNIYNYTPNIDSSYFVNFRYPNPHSPPRYE